MAEQRLAFDLHCHSNFSDGLPSIPAMEEWCRKNRAGLAITDHNEIRGSVLMAERDNVPNLPAIEVGTTEGLEFLVYFPTVSQLEEYYRRAVEPHLYSRFMVKSRVRCLECLDVARELGAFVSLAHPFAFGRKSIGKKLAAAASKDHANQVLDQVDAIEVFNAGIPGISNRYAADFYQGIEKIATLGSDAHMLSDLGNAGITMLGGSSCRGPKLFEQLRGDDFEPQAELTYSSLLRTVAVIAWKHTSFFVLSRDRYHASNRHAVPANQIG
ncbi:MAG: PHP domain-containing protein [Planctomycetaceae bacterium]|nr:PHP domain-containing protein [Planctomycetaceae bacterium]MCA9030601.1 PHP domain-containing protein [Planctomycetaceae bacterium]MCA9042739.1 PHP domain-containing protein [Planctomycetaceae bacterium]MCB9951206.1 PHP domain-containing protein [Planctomycetaceae bacterium]